MARTVEDYLELAAASRAAAAAERLENVRRVHLKAAASWESLAESARYVAFPCEQPASSEFRSAAARGNQRHNEIKGQNNESRGQPGPAVAPPSRDREAPIGDALICDGNSLAESMAEQREPTGPMPPADGASIVLYGADGNLRTLEEIEADVIRLAIDVYRGRMAEVARRLGIGRSTLYRKLSDFNIDSAAGSDSAMEM